MAREQTIVVGLQGQIWGKNSNPQCRSWQLQSLSGNQEKKKKNQMSGPLEQRLRSEVSG